MRDEDVLKSIAGDGQAYGRLVQRHQAAVSRILWRFTQDALTHQELVEEVFVQAYFRLAQYKGDAPLECWLATIATRIGYDFWRKQKRKTLQIDPADWQGIAAAPPKDPNEAAQTVHRLLAMLPPKDRLVLTLRFLEQLDVQQTAQRLGWTAGRVRVQTHRALKKLKEKCNHHHLEIDL